MSEKRQRGQSKEKQSKRRRLQIDDGKVKKAKVENVGTIFFSLDCSTEMKIKIYLGMMTLNRKRFTNRTASRKRRRKEIQTKQAFGRNETGRTKKRQKAENEKEKETEIKRKVEPRKGRRTQVMLCMGM